MEKMDRQLSGISRKTWMIIITSVILGSSVIGLVIYLMMKRKAESSSPSVVAVVNPPPIPAKINITSKLPTGSASLANGTVLSTLGSTTNGISLNATTSPYSALGLPFPASVAASSAVMTTIGTLPAISINNTAFAAPVGMGAQIGNNITIFALTQVQKNGTMTGYNAYDKTFSYRDTAYVSSQKMVMDRSLRNMLSQPITPQFDGSTVDLFVWTFSGAQLSSWYRPKLTADGTDIVYQTVVPSAGLKLYGDGETQGNLFIFSPTDNHNLCQLIIYDHAMWGQQIAQTIKYLQSEWPTLNILG